VRLLAVTLVLAWGLGGCQFDEGGLPTGDRRDAASPADAPGADAAVDVAQPDAGVPDAAVPCTDRDGDGFFAVAIPGSDCGDPDCDDDDDRVYPGQQNYYDQPAAGGGFDFDCDGTEEPLYTQVGGECTSDWWGSNCTGTGYYNGMPACGEVGQWHSCANQDGECREVSASDRPMPCR
jgi:hypothetical protein